MRLEHNDGHKLLSRVRLFATPWTVAHQAPPSMGFSRQEYWSGLPLKFFCLYHSLVHSEAGDLGSVSGLGRSSGRGNGNSLQYSCLENPMDRGACRATVHGVAKSGKRMSTRTALKACVPTSSADTQCTNHCHSSVLVAILCLGIYVCITCPRVGSASSFTHQTST